METESQYLDAARKLGIEHAENAASWATDGRLSNEHYRSMLDMLEQGDPQVWDFLPKCPDLSGEYADDLTPAGLVREIGIDDPYEDEALSDAIIDAYETAAIEAFEPAIERNLRAAYDPDA